MELSINTVLVSQASGCSALNKTSKTLREVDNPILMVLHFYYLGIFLKRPRSTKHCVKSQDTKFRRPCFGGHWAKQGMPGSALYPGQDHHVPGDRHSLVEEARCGLYSELLWTGHRLCSSCPAISEKKIASGRKTQQPHFTGREIEVWRMKWLPWLSFKLL